MVGGDEAFVGMLDAFFGYGAPRVAQPGRRPGSAEMAAGYLLNRFEGLNNEPDMEAPWSYHYAGRPDRTAEIVHAALTWQFGTGRGGLPGNDDSGGLSSWYVWASLGLFPVAGQNLFLVNAPAFSRATLHLGDRDFVIETRGHRETFAQSQARSRLRLVIAGNGPEPAHLREITQDDDRVLFLTDVEDGEKPLLMNGCAAYALPTKPEPDFVETFGIALTEKMLAGGGPVITTTTGGVGEAVGGTAVLVEAGNPVHLVAALDRVVLDMSAEERELMADRAREHALSFDRAQVFDSPFATSATAVAPTG